MFGRFPPTRALEELIWYELDKAMRRGFFTLCAVETLGVAIGVGFMYEMFGQWPSVELWLAIIGLSIIPAAVAEHLMVRWTLKRDIRLLPGTVVTTLFTAATTSHVPERLWRWVWRRFRHQP
jgi:hypothetical protein